MYPGWAAFVMPPTDRVIKHATFYHKMINSLLRSFQENRLSCKAFFGNEGNIIKSTLDT